MARVIHAPDSFALRRPHRQRGFTLIEIMIAIVVVGILTAIALPQYNEYVRRSRIVDMTSNLNDFRVRMEQFFQDRRTYANGGACGAQLPPVAVPATFTYTCVIGGGGLSYVATATGAGSMAGFGYNITVDPTLAGVGTVRTTVSVPGSWSPLPSPNTCWQTRKGGYCN